jgi:hypothetical protein
MAKDSYVVDEEDKKTAPEKVEDMKQSICIYDKDVKGISQSKLGEEVSLIVKGKIAGVSTGFGDNGPEARIDIDSIEKGGM